MSGKLGKTDLIWVAAFCHLIFTEEETLKKVGDQEDLLGLHLSYFEAILRQATKRRTSLISRQSEYMIIKITKAFSWVKFIDEGKHVWYNFYTKSPSESIPELDQRLVDQFDTSMFSK